MASETILKEQSPVRAEVNAEENENCTIPVEYQINNEKPTQPDLNSDLPVKKKRGRPLKSESIKKNLKPTRESKRIKKCPDVMNVHTFDKMKCVWSESDKKKLLSGLVEVGPDNIEELRNYLPNRNGNEIKNQIRMWKEFARVDLEKKMVTEKRKMNSATVNCISKLDEWIEYFEGLSAVSPTRLFALSNVFMLISEYGEFPSPSDCSGMDFRAMYRFIHCMLNGTPYHGVNQATAKALIEILADFQCINRETNRVQVLLPYMDSLPQQKKPQNCLKNYGRPMRGLASSRNPAAILKVTDINPLNFPPSTLSKPEDNTFDDDEEDEKDSS